MSAMIDDLARTVIATADLAVGSQHEMDSARHIVRVILIALREPREGMIEAMSNTAGAHNVNTLLSWAAAHGHSLRWKENGDPPPLTQAFTAAIDSILEEKI